MLCFITDRTLNPEGFLERVEKIMAAGAACLMLREKNLPEKEIVKLAVRTAVIVTDNGGRLIVNSSLPAALASGAWGLHLPFSALEKCGFDLSVIKKENPVKVGVSVHSLMEAETAGRAGADWLLAGNIFQSSCKKGQPGRGVNFLKAVRERMHLPLWAVGGISPANIKQVLSAGSDMACVRSPLMLSDQPNDLTKKYLEAAAICNMATADLSGYF